MAQTAPVRSHGGSKESPAGGAVAGELVGQFHASHGGERGAQREQADARAAIVDEVDHRVALVAAGARRASAACSGWESIAGRLVAPRPERARRQTDVRGHFDPKETAATRPVAEFHGTDSHLDFQLAATLLRQWPASRAGAATRRVAGGAAFQQLEVAPLARFVECS